MLSFILWGEYHESILLGRDEITVLRKAPTLNIIRRDTKHYVKVVSSPTITLVFTWGIPKRWHFWLKSNLKRKSRDKYFIEEGHHICDR